MAEPRSSTSGSAPTTRSQLDRLSQQTYRWTFNVKPKGNPFTDGDNYWVDAPTREEAIRKLQDRERLYSHDFTLMGRR